MKNIQDLQTRKFMKTHREGREIFLENLMTGAFVHNNFVSLNYAIDQLVPMIEKAIDGDPDTVVESTQKAGLLD